MQQNSRVTSFAIDREYDYIMYDTTDRIRAMNFPREIAGLLLKTDEFHLSLFEVLGEYGVDEAGYEPLASKLQCISEMLRATHATISNPLNDHALDGVHFSLQGHRRMAQAMYDAIKQVENSHKYTVTHTKQGGNV